MTYQDLSVLPFENRLEGIKVAITGTLYRYGKRLVRSEAFEFIRNMGGIPVENKTEMQMLIDGTQVAGRLQSMKEAKAAQRGIPVISGDDFMKMLS